MSTGARSVKNSIYFQAIVPGSAWSMNFSTGPAAQGLSLDQTTQQDGTTIIRLIATQDCHVAVGVNPTAVVPTPGGGKLPNQAMVKANAYTYLGVEPGWKMSVIGDSSNGVLSVTEGV